MAIENDQEFNSSDEDNINPFTEGVPVEVEITEPWKKKRYSCSGGLRIEKNFDLSYLKIATGD